MEGNNLLKNLNQVIIPQNQQSAYSTILQSYDPTSMISDMSSFKKTEPDFMDWLHEQGLINTKSPKHKPKGQMSLSQSHLNKYFPDLSMIHKAEQSWTDDH